MDFVWAAEAAGNANNTGGYWQLALVVAGIGFLGLFARWRRARRPYIPPARELRRRDEEPGRYRDAADKALVELLETSRVLNAQVDTKIRILNRLVKDADESMARLGEMLAEARAVQAGGAPASPHAVGKTPPKAEPKAPDAPKKFMTDLHQRIHHLQSEGKSVREIAKATNLSTTEVEFIVKTM